MQSVTALVIWIASAIIAAAIAESKGRNVWVAVGFGLLFGFFTVIYYWLAPGSKLYEVKRAQSKIRSLENQP